MLQHKHIQVLICRNKGTVSSESKYPGFCSIYPNHVSEHFTHCTAISSPLKNFLSSLGLHIWAHMYTVVPKGFCEDGGIFCICSFQFHLIKIMWWRLTGKNILMGLSIYLLIPPMLSPLIVSKRQYRYIIPEGHPYKYYLQLESPFIYYIWKYAYKEPAA